MATIIMPDDHQRILASVCGHQLYGLIDAASDDAMTEFTTQYCRLCKLKIIAEDVGNLITETREEHIRALAASRPGNGSIARARQARGMYDAARLMSYRLTDAIHEEEDDTTPGAAEDLTLSNSDHLQATAPSSTTGKKVRFDDTRTHPDESTHRRERGFRRDSSVYRPGVHADTSGNGFWDTSQFLD